MRYQNSSNEDKDVISTLLGQHLMEVSVDLPTHTIKEKYHEYHLSEPVASPLVYCGIFSQEKNKEAPENTPLALKEYS